MPNGLPPVKRPLRPPAKDTNSAISGEDCGAGRLSLRGINCVLAHGEQVAHSSADLSFQHSANPKVPTAHQQQRPTVLAVSITRMIKALFLPVTIRQLKRLLKRLQPLVERSEQHSARSALPFGAHTEQLAR